MANTIIHKKSSVSGKSPLTTDLALGEIAVNTYDGKIYIKKNDGTESIVEIVPITKVNIESVLTGDITSHTHTNISGNAATATNLATARTILLSGDVSGSTSFDGSSDVTITTSVADDSHNHVISNIDGLQTALNEKLDSSTYTDTDVLSKIKNVDGTGSGLDADLLDGLNSVSFLRSDVTNSVVITDKYINSTGRVLTYDFSVNPNSGIGDLDSYFDTGEVVELFSFVPTGNSQNYYVEGTVKIQSSASVETLFIRAAVRSNILPDLSWSGQYERYSENNYSTCIPRFWVNEVVGGELRLILDFVSSNIHDIEASFRVFQRGDYGEALTVLANHTTDILPTNFVEYNLHKVWEVTNAGLNTADDIAVNGNTVWHAGNDGTGSGLDADLLDGFHAAYSAIGDTIPLRNSSGDLSCRYMNTTYTAMTHSSEYRSSDTIFYSSSDNYIRKNTASGFKAALSLNNVDNTSDVNKPISTATQTALNGKLNSSGNNDNASCNIRSSGIYMEIGKGSGSVCMSVNDGYGNANLAFNHLAGTPDVTGNAGRITVNVDSTTNPYMSFQLGQGLTSGVAKALSTILTLGLTSSSFNGHVTCQTPTAGDNSTKVATTAYVVNAISEVGGKVYNHTQASANTTWTIIHNLNERLVDVVVSDSSYNQIFPDTIVFTSVNQVTLTFFESVSGYAKVKG